ncbi:hypothetical protein [Macrococcus equipercicus]|uniref:Uncharacterized protein n=1 Tax=Macrococcus equipercicus TaxID=69967 RepID=A0A9Q9F0E0_9STAP|nr:hypothetical protein [Macrococcus equipercicus]KAA1040310.1 hypothetical protein ERX35_004780 [Macrococcus equipercicus]UTH12747.1 hypothetical protein KFV11_05515 [Macrococcus equipercicus]
MANEYQWVRNEREQLLAKLQHLSDSEFNYNFGFGGGSIKAVLLKIASAYHSSFGQSDTPHLHHSGVQDYKNSLSALNFDDVLESFNQVNRLMDSEQDHYETIQKNIVNEFRQLGQIDVMLHLLENSDYPVASRTAKREKVTERRNMRITRL